MKVDRLFHKGEFVQVINDENPLFGEIGEVISYEDPHRLVVRLASGIETFVSFEEIGPWLGIKKEIELYKAHLFQLQMLAVDIGDRAWFEELGDIRKDLFIKNRL